MGKLKTAGAAAEIVSDILQAGDAFLVMAENANKLFGIGRKRLTGETNDEDLTDEEIKKAEEKRQQQNIIDAEFSDYISDDDKESEY